MRSLLTTRSFAVRCLGREFKKNGGRLKSGRKRKPRSIHSSDKTGPKLLKLEGYPFKIDLGKFAEYSNYTAYLNSVIWGYPGWRSTLEHPDPPNRSTVRFEDNHFYVVEFHLVPNTGNAATH